jgi:SHS2 domain-containing protein
MGMGSELPAGEDRWEHFPHAADMGVRGFGATPAEAFAAAALAMTAIVTDPAGVRPRQHIEVRCEAADLEFLFYDFLNELIYRMSVDGLLFGCYAVQLDGPCLTAEAWGEPVDVARHQPAVEIKGATFTELAVRRQVDETWSAQCVLDI